MADTLKAIEYARDLFNELVECGMDPTNPGETIGRIDLPDGVYLADGMSRVAVWRDGADYVIKMPLSAEFNPYCEKECEIYSDAVAAGVDEYFAWCECAIDPDDNDGVGVYVMEYLCCDEEGISDDSMEHEYQSYCEENDVDPDDDDVRESFDDWYYDYRYNFWK